MTEGHSVPIPPLELRSLVGLADAREFENPDRTPIFASYGVGLDSYESVFDFGCGCGRLARQLLLQDPKPRRYVGIDVHKGLIDWCTSNLTQINPSFEFFHHDVYSPTYARGNSLQLAQPFPVRHGEVSLVIANSIFTHLSRQQAEYYLSEVARILSPTGIAFTTWLLFDRASFPFLADVYCLHTSETDFSQAVLFDREWLLGTIRNLGLGIRSTRPPTVPGHQWRLLLARRTPDMVDDFPLGEVGADWVSGATLKPMATSTDMPGAPRTRPVPRIGSATPGRPPLFGPLAEVEQIKRSWSWRVGRAVTSPIRTIRTLFRKVVR